MRRKSALPGVAGGRQPGAVGRRGTDMDAACLVIVLLFFLGSRVLVALCERL